MGISCDKVVEYTANQANASLATTPCIAHSEDSLQFHCHISRPQVQIHSTVSLDMRSRDTLLYLESGATSLQNCDTCRENQ